MVGAGAAGLMAGIVAGRTLRAHGTGGRVLLLDGAPRVGVKILVAGGGRCNVTHHAVDERSYAGGSRNTIRKVLRAYGVDRTVSFFRDLGVELKREETGKLFPTTDNARTVLNALLGAARDASVEVRHPARVDRVERAGDGFEVSGDWGGVSARAVILATGGKALPKSGSDGGGYALARGLGHTIREPVFPALVPLVLDASSPIRELGGLALPVRLEVRAGTGKRLVSFEDAMLCTHFGVSGPGAMDISRYLTDARRADPDAALVACWLPGDDRESVEAELLGLGKRRLGRWIRERLPERLADALLEIAGVSASCAGVDLTKAARRSVLGALFEMVLPVVGDRGFTHAEVTAGGVPLEEIRVATMASRVCDGLFLCGELCDVDGRIGGFNFQWAWATGHLAGEAAGLRVSVPG